jgi:hypothetical protein
MGKLNVTRPKTMIIDDLFDIFVHIAFFSVAILV